MSAPIFKRKTQQSDVQLIAFLKCTLGGNRTHTSEDIGF